jgi:hypothetical protein
MIAAAPIGLGGCGSDNTEPNASPAPTTPSVQSSAAVTHTTEPAATAATSTEPFATVDSRPSTTLAGSETTGGVDGPVVYAAESLVGEEALGTGTVERVGDCLMLAGASPDELRRVIVWQFGTSWSDSDDTVMLPDGTPLTVGAMISAGGGYHGGDTLGYFLTSPEAIERVRMCAEYESTDNVFVIQSAVEVTP